MSIKEVFGDIACGIAKSLGRCPEDMELPGDFPIHSIAWSNLKAMLAALGLECQKKDQFAPDYYIYYTSEEGWVDLTPYLVYPASYYVAERADCDDYSGWATADASRKFKLSGCLYVEGTINNEPHAWSLVITGPNTFKMFEPNAGWPWAGELFEVGEHGYRPASWNR